MYGEIAAMPGNIRVLITVCYNWSRYSGLNSLSDGYWRLRRKTLEFCMDLNLLSILLFYDKGNGALSLLHWESN